MSFMGSLLGGLAARAVIPAVALGGVGAYKSGALDGFSLPGTSSSPSHFEMDARIISVQSDCRLFGRVNGKLQRTEAMPCPKALALLKKPSFKGYEVRQNDRTEYIYYAMDGKDTLRGTAASDRSAGGRPYRKGDVIKIRVDSKDPTQSQVI